MPFIGILKQISPSCEISIFDFSFFFLFFIPLLISNSFFDRIAPFSRTLKKKKKSIIHPHHLSRIIVTRGRFANKFHLARYRFNFFRCHFSFRIPFLAPSPPPCTLSPHLPRVTHLPVLSILPPPLFLPSTSSPLLSSSSLPSSPRSLRFPTSQGDYFFSDFPSFSSIQAKREGG